MICNPCKAQKHEECPSKKSAEANTKTMALSDAGVAIQLSGLCPCQHKVKTPAVVAAE